MKKISLVMIIILLAISASYSQSQNETETEKSYEPVTKFDPSRDAELDIKNAVVEAKKTHRRILLDVGGNWCIWCRRLDKFFEDNKDVDKYLEENYVEVKINYSRENKNEKVLSQFPKIMGYPHIFVLDKNGKFLHSQDTGLLENGHGGHDHDKVFKFLKKWAPKSKK